MSDIYKGVYEKMKFPAYSYQEYPKQVELRSPDAFGNKFKVVKNKGEELAALEEIVSVATYDKVAAEKERLERELTAANAQLVALSAQDLTKGYDLEVAAKATANVILPEEKPSTKIVK